MRPSTCRTAAASRSSTFPATSASSARWSRARPGSTSSCSSSMPPRGRGLQVPAARVERAGAGRRVAASLPGIERARLRRGDALVEPGAYPVSYRLDVALDELEPIADGARVHVHHGTGECVARVVRAGGPYAQLRLSAPAVAARRDRVVLRDRTT